MNIRYYKCTRCCEVLEQSDIILQQETNVTMVPYGNTMVALPPEDIWYCPSCYAEISEYDDEYEEPEEDSEPLNY